MNIYSLDWWKESIAYGTSGDQVHDIIASWEVDHSSLELQLAATQARLAAFEEGYDPVVHPATDTWVLMLDNEDNYIRVIYHPKINHYWSSVDWWCDDSPDLKRWFPLPGTKEAK